MYKILLLSLLFLKLNPLLAQDAWNFSTEKDGIRVYTRLDPGSKIKSLKVECDYDATLTQLVAVLLDVKSCKDWVYGTKSCSLLKQVSPLDLYYYSEVNIPWPVQNRDFVAHIVITQDAATKIVTMDAPAVPGFIPLKKGIVRIEHSSGKWIISPLTRNKIRIEYILKVDPGGALPAWLVNLLASEGPLQSFKKF